MGTRIIDIVMKCGECRSMEEVREVVLAMGRKRMYEKCKKKADGIAEVEERCGWAKLWDSTLDFGRKVVNGLMMFSRLMSHHGKGRHPFPICDVTKLEVISYEQCVTGPYLLSGSCHVPYLLTGS